MKDLLDLEPEIRDLNSAARLAVQQLHRAVSNLSFVDGKYVEIPDAEAVKLAVFAVVMVSDRAKALERLFDECFEGNAQPERARR